MNRQLFIAYLLGVGLGISLTLGVLQFSNNSLDSSPPDPASSQKPEISLVSSPSSAVSGAAVAQPSEKKSLNATVAPKHSASQEPKKSALIPLTLEAQMSRQQIARSMVEKGIYPFENDLLLLLELIEFDKSSAALALGREGLVADKEFLASSLLALEKDPQAVTQTLKKAGLIEDKAAFSKLLWLYRSDTKIQFGKKLFPAKASLREIADVLIGP